MLIWKKKKKKQKKQKLGYDQFQTLSVSIVCSFFPFFLSRFLIIIILFVNCESQKCVNCNRKLDNSCLDANSFTHTHTTTANCSNENRGGEQVGLWLCIFCHTSTKQCRRWKRRIWTKIFVLELNRCAHAKQSPTEPNEEGETKQKNQPNEQNRKRKNWVGIRRSFISSLVCCAIYPYPIQLASFHPPRLLLLLLVTGQRRDPNE